MDFEFFKEIANEILGRSSLDKLNDYYIGQNENDISLNYDKQIIQYNKLEDGSPLYLAFEDSDLELMEFLKIHSLGEGLKVYSSVVVDIDLNHPESFNSAKTLISQIGKYVKATGVQTQ